MPKFRVKSPKFERLNGEPVKVGQVVEMPQSAARRLLAARHIAAEGAAEVVDAGAASTTGARKGGTRKGGTRKAAGAKAAAKAAAKAPAKTAPAKRAAPRASRASRGPTKQQALRDIATAQGIQHALGTGK